MFWTVIALLALQSFFMAKGIENVPFFLYHMFSDDHEPKQQYAVKAIKIGDVYYDHNQLSNREYELLIGSADWYLALKEKGDPLKQTIQRRTAGLGEKTYQYFIRQLTNDSLALNKFPAWWADYFYLVTGIREREISLVTYQVTYNPKVSRMSADSILFTVNNAYAQ